MEGVYYEASATSPYHFLTIASLMPSQSTSNPIRGLPYGTNSEFSTGVRRLQLLGVRYLALHTLEAKQAADADTRLTLVATSPDLDQRPPDSWRIYRVADSPIVQSLRYQPVAVDELPSGTAQSCTGTSARAQVLPRDELSSWECLAVPWFDDAKGLDRVITDGGPAGWQHSAPKRARRLPKETLPEVRVTHVRQTDDSVSFRVSRTGVPVLVKTSYFPNWQADGARGPYRSTPNFMVVIPTRHDVKLEYGTTTADWVGRIGTGVGLVGLIGLAWWPWWRRRRGGGPEGGIGQAAG
jgi:hypothetical protein